MKRAMLLMLLFTVGVIAISAQNKVVKPNNPYSTLISAPGYITINELTAGIGLGDNVVSYSKSFFGFTTIHGYQIDKNFVIGAGTGASFYNGGAMIPLFLDFRYSFYIDTFTPYLFGDGGLLFNLSDLNNETRIFINPGIGVKYALSEKLGLNFGVGYWLQAGGSSNRDSFINVKLGVMFKPK